MKKLALAAVSTFALTNLALADGKPVWNPKLLKELQSNKKLISTYGTVGYPLADTLDPGYECKQGPNIYNMSMPFYNQTALGIPFNVGFGGEVRLVNDTSKIGAELVLGPQVEMFSNTFRPLDITFAAVTKPGNVNSLEASVNALGFTLTTIPIASSMTPITRDEAFAYDLPHQLDNSLGDTFNCPSQIWPLCDTVSWEAHIGLVGSVAGMLSFRVAPDGVEAHAVVSADAWSDVGISASGQKGDSTLTISPATGHIDVLSLRYGGLAMLRPQSGGGWVAGASSLLDIKNIMGADVKLKVGDVYERSLFHLVPKSYFKQDEFSCGFKNEMKGSK